jgi:hypothetical protein
MAIPPTISRSLRASWHRGQVVAKLKRFGIEQPLTDFFIWVIEQIPQEA